MKTPKIITFHFSMTKMTDHEHSPNVHFYLEGLSDKKTVEKGWKVDTLRGFLKRFKEENVSRFITTNTVMYNHTSGGSSIT